MPPLLRRGSSEGDCSAAQALLMNVFITGLNQLCDVAIDRVNKPDLVVASGELRFAHGAIIVAASGAAALRWGLDAAVGSPAPDGP